MTTFAFAGQFGPVPLPGNPGFAPPIVVTVTKSDTSAATLYANRGKGAYGAPSGLAANQLVADRDAMAAFYADPGYYVLSWTAYGVAHTALALVPVDPTDVATGGAGGAVATKIEDLSNVNDSPASVVGQYLAWNGTEYAPTVPPVSSTDPYGFGLCSTFPPGALRVGSNFTHSVNANDGRWFRAYGGATGAHVRIRPSTSSGNIRIAAYRNTGSGLTAAPTGAPLADTARSPAPPLGRRMSRSARRSPSTMATGCSCPATT
jgi:hypothetical protein